jgi:hypothetical protein
MKRRHVNRVRRKVRGRRKVLKPKKPTRVTKPPPKFKPKTTSLPKTVVPTLEPRMSPYSEYPVSAINPRDIYFGQHHSHSAAYFRAKHCNQWNRVKMTDSPHYQMFQGNPNPYLEYLSYSWKYHGIDMKTAKSFTTNKFKLLADIRNRGVLKPIIVYKDRENNLYSLDGNHRISCALILDLPDIKAHIVPFQNYITHLCSTNTRYGTGTPNGKPYQTLYDLSGTALYGGRRDDIIQRHRLISQHVDFSGKTLLDLGGNYGNASNLALGAGASEVHIVDYDKHVITAAVKWGILIGAHGANYYVHDLRQYAPQLPACDIGYCFSITAHVKQLGNLCRIIQDKVICVLFYETHETNKWPIEPEIKRLFKTVKLIGTLGDRKLYMCTK